MYGGAFVDCVLYSCSFGNVTQLLTRAQLLSGVHVDRSVVWSRCSTSGCLHL